MRRSSALSPRRWPIARLLSRNPLVRGSDRAEAFAVCLAVLLAVLAVPLAVMVQDSVHTSRSDAIAEQQRTIHPVEATAVEDSSVILTEGQSGSLVTARWSYKSIGHEETVNVDTSTKAGDRFTVWVDDRGASTRQPLTPADALSGAILTAVAFYLGVLALLAVLARSVTAIIDRRRQRGWDSARA